MLPDDSRGEIKNITAGTFIEGQQDNCATIRNLLCASYPTGTTVKSDFESKAIIKKGQAQLIDKYISENDLWLADLRLQEGHLTRGGEAETKLRQF